jgi:hypothetical protein
LSQQKHQTERIAVKFVNNQELLALNLKLDLVTPQYDYLAVFLSRLLIEFQLFLHSVIGLKSHLELGIHR